MKKLFLSTFIVLFLIGSTTMASSKFIYGVGAKGKTFADDTKEFMITQTIGISTSLESITLFGPLTPDEVFVMFNYGRAKTPEGFEEKHIGVYESSFRGVWKLTKDSTSDFVPFFHATAAYELESAEFIETENIFSGDFGLGFEYKLNDNYGFHLSGAAKISDIVSYEGLVGLYFFLGK